MRNVLPAIAVEDWELWHSSLGSWMYTGQPARDAIRAWPGGTASIDIETPSLTDSFTIKCVTLAWEGHEGTVSVLLNPLRDDRDAEAVREAVDKASALVLQNAPFDIPGLVAAKLMDLADIAKVWDTVVYARMAYTDRLERKGLDDLAVRLLGMASTKDVLAVARRASGLVSVESWYRDADIHMLTYRIGALADTVVTLRVLDPVREAAIARQLDHPFGVRGLSHRSEAEELTLRAQRVHRVMLRRAARGYNVDTEYLHKYRESVHEEKLAAEAVMHDLGLKPGYGAAVVAYLDSRGELPDGWPRTRTGKLQATKGLMEALDHPLAHTHRVIAGTDKVLGYLDKVVDRAEFTGRVHPQFHTHGASASGRQSVSEPELQQFPGDARPIILGDSPMTSVDFSAIEPGLLGWMGQDRRFVAPYEAGADIYLPVADLAGVDRKTAKVVLLADMYGRGGHSLAAQLGKSEEEVSYIRRRMRDAMPTAARFMGRVSNLAAQSGLTITMSGRVLTVPVNKKRGGYMAYKAVNGMFQGSCADMLMDSIDQADKEGLGDEIHLPMHDELVCSTEAADDISRIMRTPHPRLIAWAGRDDIRIRVDRDDIGLAWKKSE